MMDLQTIFDELNINAYLDRKYLELFAGLYFPKDSVWMICKNWEQTEEILSNRSAKSLAQWKQLCKVNKCAFYLAQLTFKLVELLNPSSDREITILALS